MNHRVVVTGMGVVSPVGRNVADFAEAIRAGRSGVGTITLFDPAHLRTRIAAQVNAPVHDFRDRKIAFALEAAQEAVSDASAHGSGFGGGNGNDASVSLGMGLELFSLDDLATMRQPGFAPPSKPAERMTFLQTPSDLCVHALGCQYNLGRPPTLHTSACASGTDAIGQAFHMVRSGRRRWMLAGGTDSMINPMGVGGFCKISATSTHNDGPTSA